MTITSKSLHHANIVFLFDETRVAQPDNALFSALYTGKDSVGARFLDDPLINTKMLTLPAVGLRIIAEKSRLRIEDESQNDPQKSRLMKDAPRIWQTLYPTAHITGFGFNLDMFFRFNNVVPMQRMFETFFGKNLLEKNTLLDLGTQFTLKKSDTVSEMWAVKITAPVEVAVHINRHFNTNGLPQAEKLQLLFETCYNESDGVMEQFAQRNS